MRSGMPAIIDPLGREYLAGQGFEHDLVELLRRDIAARTARIAIGACGFAFVKRLR